LEADGGLDVVDCFAAPQFLSWMGVSVVAAGSGVGSSLGSIAIFSSLRLLFMGSFSVVFAGGMPAL